MHLNFLIFLLSGILHSEKKVATFIFDKQQYAAAKFDKKQHAAAKVYK